MVFWLTGRHDRAREYLDKCLKTSPSAKVHVPLMYLYMSCIIMNLGHGFKRMD